MNLLLLAITLTLAAAPSTAQTPRAGSAVVVGAGLSGLAAADALCAKGFSVTVLEGRARTGGRTFTAKLPVTGAQVDVGAQWIHAADTTTNSIAKFIADNGIATQTDDEEEATWVVRDAPPALAKPATDAQLNAWEATAGDFQDLISEAEDSWQANRSLQSYFDAFASSERLAGDALAAARSLLASESADLEYGATAAKMSARWADEGEEGDGPEKVITRGYSAVVDFLVARIQSRPSCGKSAIVLSAPVAEIKTVASPSAQRGVYVRLANGTTLSAKFAVTTLPLGVLKKGGVRFVPALSTDKQTCLSKLGMGLLNKIALVYDRPFFLKPDLNGADTPASTSWFQPITGAGNPRPPSEGASYQFWNHARFWPGSNAVVMLLGADTAANWEALNAGKTTAERDRLLAQRADALFRQLLPSSTAVLRESLVTRWSADPFSYGSYSYLAVGAAPGMRARLCAAQGGLLFWAGEHCSQRYPSTAHGALDTGVAAAKAAMAKFAAPVSGGRR